MNSFALTRIFAFHANQRSADAWEALYAGLNGARTATGVDARLAAFQKGHAALRKALTDLLTAAAPELGVLGVRVTLNDGPGPTVAGLDAAGVKARISVEHDSIEETLLTAVLDLARGGAARRTLEDVLAFYMKRFDPAGCPKHLDEDAWHADEDASLAAFGEVWEALWAAATPELNLRLARGGVTATPALGYSAGVSADMGIFAPGLWLEGPGGRVPVSCEHLHEAGVEYLADQLARQARKAKAPSREKALAA